MTVRGLEIMNDDPSEVRVLYGRVESEALQDICDKIYGYFISKGLSKREYNRDTVKLHLTLINVRNDKDPQDENGEKRRDGRRLHFDARHIIEEFGDFQFGSDEVKEIHLSVMGSEDSDGYYLATAVMQI